MEKAGGLCMVNDLKWTTVTSGEVSEAKFQLKASSFNVAAKKAKADLANCKYELYPMVGEDGFATAYRPGIVKRIFVEKGFGIPMFTPSEITTINPKPEKYLSKYTKTDLNAWKLKEREIALTCSGTIGHAAYVSKTLVGKCFSQNMIRIVASEFPGYIYAFIKSNTGQLIIQTNNYGAVIQHIDPEHLEGIFVPNPPDEVKKSIHEKIVRSFELRDISNEHLNEAEQYLIKALRLQPIEKMKPEYFDTEYRVENFIVPLNQLNERLDSTYHNPIVGSIIDCLLDNADTILPLGNSDLTTNAYIPNRFKRIYVEDSEDGVPFFSGKSLLELDPSNKKYISRSFHKDRIGKQLIIKEGMILVTCSGTTGKVNIVPEHWDNWVMTHDIIRVIPKNKDITGYLFVWLNSEYGNVLIRRNDYGSVVPHIETEHILKVPVPILKDKALMKKINDLAMEANKLRSEAFYLEEQAIKEMNEKVIFNKGAKPKGLSDKELVKKYEAGKMPMRKIMKAMLTTPPPPPEKTKKR
jgi:type I restriction enzyme S subunit